jgi:hypothetical protein
VLYERSGRVRDAFGALGHDVVSVDLKPTLSTAPYPHVESDVFEWLYNHQDWHYDLAIAFPPCTYLSSAGLHLHKGTVEHFNALLDVALLMRDLDGRWAIENPAGAIGSCIRPADQYIQPWQFGHHETKKTGLWLKGLPLLRPTNVVSGRRSTSNDLRTSARWVGPGFNQRETRGFTYPGIAQAMAQQWGK